ncbi:MAG: ATP-binding cassette domain-containing protein [Deltaproteobacteria bacterium]
MAAIKLENIGYSIGGRVLFSGLSAEFNLGEKVGIVGEAGSGRSDLLNLLSGLTAPDTGSIYILDMDINRIGSLELDSLRKRIGFVFQNAVLISNLKVIQNVILPLQYHTDLTDEAIMERGLGLLTRAGYNEDIWALPALLPPFKKKEVAFARAMALNPDIMIYDRFLEGLDYRQREFMIGLIEDTHGSGVQRLSIFTANDVEEIKGISLDRIFMIKDKTLVRQDG